jgi:hypothetical protein
VEVSEEKEKEKKGKKRRCGGGKKSGSGLRRIISDVLSLAG